MPRFAEGSFPTMRARGTGRKLAGAIAATVALLQVTACAFIPYSASAQTVSLRVQGNVADAQVTIDDLPLGALGYVASHGVALPPGRHRVTVEKAGYFPWDAVLEAQDEPIFLKVNLVPIPD
jgi:PEGA domain